MASIKGYSLKAIKTFLGQEGYGFSANIYLNKKKIGFVYDNADGGQLSINIDNALYGDFETAVKKYYVEHPATFEGEDMFIEELFALTEQEKDYKKMVKKGYPVFMVVSYEKRNARPDELFGRGLKPDRSMGIRSLDDVEDVKQDFPDAVEFHVYKSLEDFNIE